MNLSTLPKTSSKGKKRIGRGYGSGRGGHASTRGTKGQKARGKIGLFFQGTKFKKSLLKRLPLARGKGKLKPRKAGTAVVNLKYLSFFEKDEEVNLASLKAKGILPKTLPEETTVKILGEGEINVPLVVVLPVSKGAREKIEKAGGKVITQSETSAAAKKTISEEKGAEKEKAVKKPRKRQAKE
jgi:large subunit ribosomal protein L15